MKYNVIVADQSGKIREYIIGVSRTRRRFLFSGKFVDKTGKSPRKANVKGAIKKLYDVASVISTVSVFLGVVL